MFKIDNKTYDNEKVKVSWGEFSSSYLEDGIRKERCGKSPYFDIEIINENNEEISLGIETTICDNELNELKIGKEIDMNKYISDIIYSINGIWESIYEKDFISSIKKIKDNIFNFEMNYKPLNIIINCNIEIIS